MQNKIARLLLLLFVVTFTNLYYTSNSNEMGNCLMPKSSQKLPKENDVLRVLDTSKIVKHSVVAVLPGGDSVILHQASQQVNNTSSQFEVLPDTSNIRIGPIKSNSNPSGDLYFVINK